MWSKTIFFKLMVHPFNVSVLKYPLSRGLGGSTRKKLVLTRGEPVNSTQKLPGLEQRLPKENSANKRVSKAVKGVEEGAERRKSVTTPCHIPFNKEIWVRKVLLTTLMRQKHLYFKSLFYWIRHLIKYKVYQILAPSPAIKLKLQRTVSKHPTSPTCNVNKSCRRNKMERHFHWCSISNAPPWGAQQRHCGNNLLSRLMSE